MEESSAGRSISVFAAVEACCEGSPATSSASKDDEGTETVVVSEGFESGNFAIRSRRTVAWLSALILAEELERNRDRRTEWLGR